MRTPTGFRLPDPETWRQLDRLLEEILDLAPARQAERLEQLADHFPELVPALQCLVDCAGDGLELDRALTQALRYLADSEAMPAQRRFGPWRLVSTIGRGGMAQVFLAERADGAYQQQVALKLMWPGLAGSVGIDRFNRERQLLANMDDSRIARLLDGGVSDDGRPWLAMEYVQGRPITRYCDEGELTVRERLILFGQVTGAVAAAHRRLTVHGDLKPGNVLVTDDGRVKLLDFGIGRLLEGHPDDDQAAALTPRYASPEQRRRQPVTTASDVYQLGALLRELVAGRRTSRALGADIAALANRAMAADPERRYPSVDALEADIRAALDYRPLAARHGKQFYRIGRFAMRHRFGVAAAVLAGVLLVAALGVYHGQARRIAAEAEVNRSVIAFLEDMLYAGDPYTADRRPTIPGEVLDDAARRVDTELAGQPRVQAHILNVLGQVYRSRGEGLEALEHLERARAIAERHGLSEELTRSRAGIASVGIWSGGYATAEHTLRSVLAEDMARYGADAAITARTRLNLADLLHSRGFYQAAEVEVLPILAGNHDVAWGHRVMGMILRDWGRFDEADRHLGRALALERARPGPKRDSLAIVLEHYGQLRLHTGRTAEARAMLDEALAIRRELLGADWDGLVWTRHWLGLAALAAGDLDRAEALLETTVAHYRRAFSESSHLLAFARADLGWVQLARGRADAAGRLFQAAADGLEPVQPDDHPRIAEPLLGLAAVALARGETAASRAHARRALRIRRPILGAAAREHPWTASACRVYRAAGGACDEVLQPEFENYLDPFRTAMALRFR